MKPIKTCPKLEEQLFKEIVGTFEKGVKFSPGTSEKCIGAVWEPNKGEITKKEIDSVLANIKMKDSVKTKASDLLEKASNIMKERGKQYDKPDGERSMGKCIAAFNIITDNKLTEAEGWLILQLLKDVRLWQKPGYHADSAEDCIAYAALKAEAKSGEFTE